MRKFILAALVLTLFISCQNDDTTTLTDAEPVAVEFTTVYKDQSAGEDGVAGTYVINDQGAWNSFTGNIAFGNSYDPVTGILTSDFDAITIDYDESTVIAVIDAQHYTGGYDLEITSALQLQDTITVGVHTTAPGDESVDMILSNPVHIIRIPKTILPIVFETITP